ncbi:uncharacterized protein TNCV_25921 [Trichonephila clavipes]|uniref:Uncharacterized protein n=1 Tax=Trichonephila clavipes TaxID=2585209 RepID=A0A8X6W1M8_TRICX|nr:uncharacterized protein TNCV_25921 [Trichonephila clavipes]
MVERKMLPTAIIGFWAADRVLLNGHIKCLSFSKGMKIFTLCVKLLPSLWEIEFYRESSLPRVNSKNNGNLRRCDKGYHINAFIAFSDKFGKNTILPRNHREYSRIDPSGNFHEARWSNPPPGDGGSTFLNQHLPKHWIGRSGDADDVLCSWPPRSPDFTPCDFLWGYVLTIPKTIEELKVRIWNTLASVIA